MQQNILKTQTFETIENIKRKCKRKICTKLVNKKLKLLSLHFYELYRANVDLIYLQMKYSRVVLKNSVAYN